MNIHLHSYTFVYLIKHKFKVFEKFKNSEVQNQAGKNVAALQLN